LDVNVLIALVWSFHVHHEQARHWFREQRRAGIRTCPITQAGFVRISSNPRFTPDALTPDHAIALLASITSIPEHEFWPDDLPVSRAVLPGMLATHRQVTDAYLVALAKSRGGVLATLDRGVLGLGVELAASVEVLG
jgi:toxin-antitoxin system PIN domain toxin